VFKELEVGDWVYRKVVPKSTYKYYLDQKEYKIIKKLQFRFNGPHKIVKKLSPVLYAILENGEVKTYHALNLKPAGSVNSLAADII
jgi:hypothetical protein